MTDTSQAKQAIAIKTIRPMSVQVAEVRQNITIMHQALKSVMKKDVHYGMIPGCPKLSLFKPGAEVIMALFRLSSNPDVNDMSKDGEIRYQVKVNIKAKDGAFVGAGIGECSSGEEKYMWRAALNQAEFESFPETMRRIKFKKDKYTGKVDEIQQVRVPPSDLANTILKMAKKRALIDAVLTATGASDIFSQDIEDMPEEYAASEVARETPKATVAQEEAPVAWTPETDAPTPPPQPSGNIISEPQRKRLYAISMGAGMTQEIFKDWLKAKFGFASSKDVTKEHYEQVCEAAKAYQA